MWRILHKFNVGIGILNGISSIGGAIYLFIEGEIVIGIAVGIGGLLYTAFVAVLLGTIVETGKNVELMKAEMTGIKRFISEAGINVINSVSSACTSESIQFSREPQSFKGRTSSGTGQWRCSFCGRVNMNYTGRCECGHTKWESNDTNA